ncbi:MAG: succinylglutamate desuccinylase/aspartoacylase family protein [Ilumatobacter sp.]|uniref:succinylglutamate desuccinylase/aspartoacylase family protein n=1 Tax=Ilumatobacter sp. TaxID=1967498 RepID=UPI00391B79DB
MNEVVWRDLEFGARVDGTPFRIRLAKVTGGRPGPTTAVVGGMWGDKPMGCLSVHELIEIVRSADDLSGSVVFAPAVNLPALSVGRRYSPDGIQLNRRFPGRERGFLNDQIAHLLMEEVVGPADVVVDLHSGTPDMSLHYTYDFGCLELSAAFGRLPIVVGHTYPGQLCSAAAAADVPACLPEFGGGPSTSLTDGVEGVCNVLRWTGQLGGELAGPRSLPVIDEVTLELVSTHGILVSSVDPASTGDDIDAGVLGEVRSAVDGSVLERFELDRDGILLMSRCTPIMVTPGDYAFMVGHPSDRIELPARGSFRS